MTTGMTKSFVSTKIVELPDLKTNIMNEEAKLTKEEREKIRLDNTFKCITEVYENCQKNLPARLIFSDNGVPLTTKYHISATFSRVRFIYLNLIKLENKNIIWIAGKPTLKMAQDLLDTEYIEFKKRKSDDLTTQEAKILKALNILYDKSNDSFVNKNIAFTYKDYNSDFPEIIDYLEANPISRFTISLLGKLGYVELKAKKNFCKYIKSRPTNEDAIFIADAIRKTRGINKKIKARSIDEIKTTISNEAQVINASIQEYTKEEILKEAKAQEINFPESKDFETHLFNFISNKLDELKQELKEELREELKLVNTKLDNIDNKETIILDNQNELAKITGLMLDNSLKEIQLVIQEKKDEKLKNK